MFVSRGNGQKWPAGDPWGRLCELKRANRSWCLTMVFFMFLTCALFSYGEAMKWDSKVFSLPRSFLWYDCEIDVYLNTAPQNEVQDKNSPHAYDLQSPIGGSLSVSAVDDAKGRAKTYTSVLLMARLGSNFFLMSASSGQLCVPVELRAASNQVNWISWNGSPYLLH